MGAAQRDEGLTGRIGKRQLCEREQIIEAVDPNQSGRMNGPKATFSAAKKR